MARRVGGWGRPGWWPAVGAALLLCASTGVLGFARRGMRAPPGPAAPVEVGGASARSGLHITRDGTTVPFPYRTLDGGGFLWEFQGNGGVYQQTNYCYAGGQALYVQGGGFPTGSSARLNRAGDEFEVGPYQMGAITVSRRVRVYRTEALVRWLDIYENPSDSPVAVTVMLQSNRNWQITQIQTSTGGISFGDKDWAFLSDAPSGGFPTPPPMMHVVCEPKAKVRPTVMVQSSVITVSWSISIPARQAAVVCYFDSQGTSFDQLRQRMKSFSVRKLLGDLPQRVRNLIVNWGVGGGYEELSLDRSGVFDTVWLSSGDPLYGRVRNESYSVEAFFGRLDLPAIRMVGMALDPSNETMRALLTDGQVVSGRPAGQKLSLELAAGGELEIPLDRVSQWSYQVSPSRPAETPSEGTFLVLRNGDRLLFDASALTLKLRTLHGEAVLEGGHLSAVRMDNGGSSVHRVVFGNGSSLGGILAGEKITAPLKLGPKLEVGRDMISEMRFGPEEPGDLPMVRATLLNGDELAGSVMDETIGLQTGYGELNVPSGSIRRLTVPPHARGQALLELWDGTILRGHIRQEELAFQVTPGPTLRIAAHQFRQIVRPHALPPGKILTRVEQLLANLAGESHVDRMKAIEELRQFGTVILPMLRSRLRTCDPDIRQTLDRLIETIEGKTKPHPALMNPVRYSSCFFGG